MTQRSHLGVKEMTQLDALTEWRVAGGSFLWRGQDIFVRTGGDEDAPALLLIHGFPSASYDWHPLWDRLCQHFRVITLDMIGFGFSDKPLDFDYSIKAQANLIETLLVGMEVSNFTIFAHDYGNTVAQELLARHLEGKLRGSIDRICFLNGGLFPEVHRPVLAQKLLISPIGGLFARFINQKKITRNFRAICSDQLHDDDIAAFWQLLEHNQGRKVMPKLIHYMAERRQFRERWVGALQKTALPMRIIDGVTDPISGEHMVARYEEIVSNPDVVRLEGIGHYPHLEAPDQVWQHFIDWAEKA